MQVTSHFKSKAATEININLKTFLSYFIQKFSSEQYGTVTVQLQIVQ